MSLQVAMSKKSPKIAALITDCQGHATHDAHYLGYFKCFNAQLYYEAHDVLEELWLTHRPGPNAAYYQGLIQMTGAFVHLQKNKLGPASKLFALALKNFQPYGDAHEGFDLAGARHLSRQMLLELEAANFTVNPWSPERAPQLVVPA